MGFNIRGGDKSSLALLSSKRGRAYARTRADEAFALPSFSDAMPVSTTEPQHQSNNTLRPEHPAEPGAENVKQTMLQHESVFKEQLHELHRLYQKQCMLMAESKNVPVFEQLPEPPSSNGSFLCNQETLRVQEEKSFGDASFSKVCGTGQTYCTLPNRMYDEKYLEDGGSCRKQISHQSFEDSQLSKKHSEPRMFNLEQPVVNRTIIDLECPADEYEEVEVEDEKPSIAGLTFESANAYMSGHVYLSGSNNDREKTELHSRDSRASPGNKLFGYQMINDTKVFQNTRNSQEEMRKGCLQQREISSKHPTFSEVQRFSMAPAMDLAYFKDLAYSKEEPALYSKEASSSSGCVRGLPDLNGDVSLTEQLAPPMQTVLEKNVKNHQCIDLEVDSRACSTTSKLPHWLRQATSTRPSPLHVSAQTSQTSVCQAKSSMFFSQVHDKTMKASCSQPDVLDTTSWCSSLPMDATKALFTQKSSCPTAPSMRVFEQGEVLFGETHRPLSSQLFRGSSSAMAEMSYTGVPDREYISGGLPFIFPPGRDSEKVGMRTVLPNSFPSVSGIPLEFDTSGPSAEPLSSFSLERPATFSTMSMWYPQRESFSSLMQQASNAEPLYNKSAPVTSVNKTVFSYQGPPSVREPRDRGNCRLETNVRNIDPFPSCVKSTTASFAFGPMYLGSELGGGTLDIGMMESRIAKGDQGETSRQAGDVSKGELNRDLNSRKRPFDLNVSSDEFMVEGNIDACNLMDNSSYSNKQQGHKEEADMRRSIGWHTVGGMKAPQLYEPQRERVATKGIASEVLTVNTSAIDLHNETFPSLRAADVLSAQADILRNDAPADCCSGEDETGGGFARVKSSDSSGLTSCESKDAVYMELIKVRDNSNTSSGEACHSDESTRMLDSKGDRVFPPSFQSSTRLPAQVSGLSGAQVKSFFFPDLEVVGPDDDTKRDCSADNCMEFADECEAVNFIAKKEMFDASEAAELLLSLGMDLPVVALDDDAIKDSRKCLDWLADIIPPDEFCQLRDLDVEMTSNLKAELERSTEQRLEVSAGKTFDPFESAVLALKPVEPHLEFITAKPLDRGNIVENIPTLRRRPSRRGRGGKDFQKEMLRSMISLSRHEVTEDLQIIEGLIKSTAETINNCSTSPDDKPLSGLEQGFARSLGNEKSTKSCRGRKLNGISNGCSWGESTRRKRMGRQRSQWLSLPPGVRASLFPDKLEM